MEMGKMDSLVLLEEELAGVSGKALTIYQHIHQHHPSAPGPQPTNKQSKTYLSLGNLKHTSKI